MTQADSLIPVRLLNVDDQVTLTRFDEDYSSSLGLPPVLSRASAQFYARSGHSFVAGGAGTVLGFVLGHAIWTGGRPVGRTERLAASGPDAGRTRAALLAALVKSAYDAGVYDLLVEQPLADGAAAAALSAAAFQQQEVRLYSRTLGSRGAGVAQ
jgi:hypothetical protein